MSRPSDGGAPFGARTGSTPASAPRRRAHGHRLGATRRRPRGTWLRRSGQVLAAALSFLLLLGSGYAWSSYQTFTSNVTHVDAITPAQPGHKDADGPSQNILLVGDDHRPAGASPALLKMLSTGEDGGGLNTDTVMLLHIPAGGTKATSISFPRDSWVDVPGFGLNKLNAAFQLGAQNGGGDVGGSRLLIQVIQNLTGLRIDHFVRVSMVGFYDIAQTLGPIRVCLNQAAHDSYSGTNLPAGWSTLNAQQALSFVRQRHGLPRGDLDREVRQQYFLAAELRKITSAGVLLNPIKLQQLLKSVSSALETDPGLDLLSFASQFANLSAGNVTFATIPITGTPTISFEGNEVSIVAVDHGAMPAFIARVIGDPPAYTSATAAAPSTVTVQVSNGGAATGAAAADSATLEQYGFHPLAPTSRDTTTTTVIEYAPGMESQAKAVAARVPGAVAVLTAGVHEVTLVLGTDGHRVTPKTAPTPPAAGTTAPTPAATSASPTSPAQAFTQSDCIN